ncbi:MAG: O-antigen ligase family protein [Candidatus Sumerlaeota bacterium]|nr:O-antigen ligase family protein [Candidatus Sumerlaeota bacterium]
MDAAIERARAVCVYLLFCFTPLLIFTAATDQYIRPKQTWISLVTSALLVLTAIRAARGKPVFLWLNLSTAFIALWLLWNTFSIAWARSRSLAWDASREWWTLALAAGLALDVLGEDRRRLIRLGWGLCASALLLAGWTLYLDGVGAWRPQWLHLAARLPDWRNYISAAGLGNTGHIADFLALTFPIALLFYLSARRRRHRIAAGAVMALDAAAMIVCWSVHSNAGLILAAVLMIGALSRHFGGRWRRRRAARAAIIVAVFVGVAAFFFTDHAFNPHAPSIWKQAYSSPRWKEGGTTRLAIWKPALRMAADHRLLGVGAGNFEYVYPSVVLDSLQRDPKLGGYAGQYTNAAHNEPLQAWCELGVVGFFLLTILAASAFWLLAQRRAQGAPATVMIRIALLGFLAAFVVHAQMNFNLRLPVTSLMFLCAVALIGRLKDRGEVARAGALALETGFGPFSIEARALEMKRFDKVGLKANGRAGAIFLLIAALALAAAMATGAARRQYSDYEYYLAKRAHEQLRALRQTVPLIGDPRAIPNTRAFDPPEALAQRAEAERYYRRALGINPNHHDCRSAFVTFLMEEQRYPEALAQLALVMRRLDSGELYDRRALCRWETGDAKGALEDWLIFFRRLPVERLRRSDQLKWVLEEAKKAGLLNQAQPES